MELFIPPTDHLKRKIHDLIEKNYKRMSQLIIVNTQTLLSKSEHFNCYSIQTKHKISVFLMFQCIKQIIKYQ